MYLVYFPVVDEYKDTIRGQGIAIQNAIDRMEQKDAKLVELNQEYADEIGAHNDTIRKVRHLEEELATAEKTIEILEDEISTLGDEVEYLTASYNGLLNTLNLFRLSNFSRRFTEVLECTTPGSKSKTWEFDAGYGVIMVITFGWSKTAYQGYISTEVSWKRGDQRGYLGSSGYAVAEKPDSITVEVWCEVYDAGEEYFNVDAGAKPLEFPWTGAGRSGRFRKYVDVLQFEFVRNGGL